MRPWRDALFVSNKARQDPRIQGPVMFSIPPRWQRYGRLIVLGTFVSLVFVTYRWKQQLVPIAVPPESHAEATLLFWRRFSALLAQDAPQCPPPTLTKAAPFIGFDYRIDTLTRPDLVKMSPDDVKHMANAHSRMVKRLADRPPRLPYIAGSRGIVTTASRKYLPVALVSLRMLRRTRSSLPVELWFLAQEDYDAPLCEGEGELRKLNVECKVLSSILSTVPSPESVTRSQAQVLAILFSRFEHVFSLHPDAMVVQKPDTLFENEPYTSRGLVLWPDHWVQTTSPLFGEITRSRTPALFETPSAESGQILISRRKHASTLLLATYYNYYGPKYFYPLLNQGSPGEGDKDTFAAAARVLKNRVYMLRDPPRSLGFTDAGGYHANAMAQANPEEDYKVHTSWAKQAARAKPFTIHTTVAKLNPPELPFHGMKGMRLWGDKDRLKKTFGRDIEKEAYEEVVYVSCELGDANVAKTGNWKQNGICKRMNEHFRKAFGS